MLLDLRGIIGVPGERVSFDYEPDLSDVAYGCVLCVRSPSRTAGSVANGAGVLTLTANVDAVLICVCARCLVEFELPVHRDIAVVLTQGGENGDNPDTYLLRGDDVDLDEVIITEFILQTDEVFLCRDDCKGLCPKCGADLNEKPCSCKDEIDPRLAVLGRLLDNE